MRQKVRNIVLMTLIELQKAYIKERVNLVDKDYKSYEENFVKKQDIEQIGNLLREGYKGNNPHNSILLYLTGLTDEFDFSKGRADTIDGTPGDIDIDFAPSIRPQVKQYILDTYGNDYVAQIGAIGKEKLRSAADDFYRIKQPIMPKKSDYETKEAFEEAMKVFRVRFARIQRTKAELKDLIPEPIAGKEPTLEEALEQNPEIQTKFPDFYEFAKHADGQRSQMGVHAAGVLISPEPIADYIPLWKNKKYEHITQFDKDEVEKLGFIKFDLLVVSALDTINLAIKLINKEHKINLTDEYIYTHLDDSMTYKMIGLGMLVGVFQMETSGTAHDLIMKIQPKDIYALSDINALNRPGCLTPIQDEKGNIVGPPIVEDYLSINPEDPVPSSLPEKLIPILKPTRYCIIYQEQIMRIFSDLAGFTLREADDARRAIGKKKVEVLEALRGKFIDGCVNHDSCDKKYAENLFNQIILFAAYGFNLCLIPGTQVKTSEGPKAIQDLEINKDILYCFDGVKEVPTLLKDVIESGEQETYLITFDNGDEVECTIHHKFLCDDGLYHSINEIQKEDLNVISLA